MDYKAFVSSTYVDLKQHRATAIGALRKAGFFVDPMEDWTSSSQEPKVFSTDRLRGCHLCVLLVARRRGHIPDGEKYSITQLEHREAIRRKIDVLPFLLDDAETAWRSDCDELASDDELRRWRDEIAEHHGVEHFTKEPSSLAISSALTRWVKDTGPKVALRLYLEGVKHEHGVIRFVSLPRLEDNPDTPIDKLYVEPAVAPRWISPDTQPDDWPHTHAILDSLSANKRIVLLGDPGSGKSTVISWIAWHLAQHHDGNSKWVERLGKLIPLPIILRELGISRNVTWDILLDKFVKTSFGRLLTLTNLRQTLSDGQALIMLDGIDEIANPAVRRDLRDAVFAGFERYRTCRWLLTSRVVGYDDIPFHRIPKDGSQLDEDASDTINLQYMAPFDKGRIERFSRNWFLMREPVEEKATSQSEEFLDALDADNATHNLARVPNLLTMMALIYRVRARLPHGRALLYNEIAQAYLETIDFYRRIMTRTEPLADRKRWLSRVAFEMQYQRARQVSETEFRTNGEIYASTSEIREWIEAAMSRTSLEPVSSDADAFVDYLGKRTGLLLPRGDNRYAFMHLSFQEYFAACFLKEHLTSPGWLKDDKASIDPRAAKRALNEYAKSFLWRETLVFLVELLATENPQWLDATRDCMFGHDFDELSPTRFTPLRNRMSDWSARLFPGRRNTQLRKSDAIGQALLLARLAANPHTNLTDERRRLAVEVCCYWALEASMNATDSMDAEGLPLAKTPILTPILSSSIPEAPTIADQIYQHARDTRIRGLNLSDLKQVRDLKGLAEIPSLEHLDLSNTSASDASPLAQLTRLVTLSIRRTEIVSLTALSDLQKLMTLDISYTKVSDLSPLRFLKMLTSLYASQTQIAHLRPLQGLRHLKQLDIGWSSVADLEPVAHLDQLETLRITRTEITKLPALRSLQSLSELWMSFTPIVDLGPLAELKALETLVLTHTQVADLKPLEALPLTFVTFTNTPVADLSPLASIETIRFIACANTLITNVEPLTRLVQLRTLDISHTRVSDLTPLLGLSSSLSELRLYGSAVSDDHLAMFRTRWAQMTDRPLTIAR